MGYTRFGKKVKKMMIDRDENLGTLAKLLNVSTAFVSSVLIGNKSIPEDWYRALCNHYALNEEDKNDLYDAFCETKKMIRVDLSNVQNDKKKLALEFQRKLPSISQSELNSIREILKEDN